VFITYAALLVIGGILLVVDLFIGAVLVTNVSGALWLAARGVETTGRVTLVEERQPGSPAQILVAYDTPGGRFQTEGTAERAQLGGEIPVRYHPAKPSFATTLTRPWARTFVGIPTVLAILAVSVGMVTSALWYFHGSHAKLRVPLAGASFLGALALALAYYAVGRYTVLFRWRRMVRVDGKVMRFNEKSPVGPGILISFTSADGREEFWARAGSIDVGAGDAVTVYYDPAKAATSATVQNAGDVRAYAIGSTVFALVFGALAIFALTRL
jgi:hypothetical protein